MTIQEKYKYLYDNYAYTEEGFLSEIVLVFLATGMITDKENSKIHVLYNSKTEPGMSIYSYLKPLPNNIILVIELLYSKCKAFEENES